MQLLRKLHQNYIKKNGDSKAGAPPNGAKDESKKDDKDTGEKNEKGRKPNFFERKRFVNYENNSYSDDENNGKAADGKGDKAKKPDVGVTKEIIDNNIVQKEPSKAPDIAEIF